jgi:hypothetical protein
MPRLSTEKHRIAEHNMVFFCSQQNSTSSISRRIRVYTYSIASKIHIRYWNDISAEGNGFPTGGHGKKSFCSPISGNFRIRASNSLTYGNLAQGTEQMAIFFSFEGYPGLHGKKLFFQTFG